MNSKIHFLGTGGMVPTKDRNHIAVALEFNGNIFMFDCGEAAQNQIKKMKLPIGKIKKIFISHWHGDHTLGLGGLIQTMMNTDNIEVIEIHGPIDSKKYVKNILNSSIFDIKVPVNVFEHIPKKGEIIKIIETGTYEINCVKLNHSTPCIGYSFKEKDTLNVDMEKAEKLGLSQSPMLARVKMGLDIEVEGKKIKSTDITYAKEGLKVAFVFDTRPCPEINLLVKNSDYLVMEATHIYSKHAQKAEETDHMTARESAEIAAENDVRNLYITHFSQRYKDIKEIEEEAKEFFENTTSTYDLMTVKLKK